MEMIRRSGQQGVPVVATADEVILGFDQVRLARLAEKYSAPKRPPLGLLAANAEEYLGRHPELAMTVPPSTTGVYVGKVRPNTVAQRAGLQTGDIIMSLAGKRVRSMTMLDQLISTLNAGDAVPLRFWRNGTVETTTLQF